METPLRRVRPPRSKVWVLMGGESSERQHSLASGLNVVAKLRRYEDLQARLLLLI